MHIKRSWVAVVLVCIMAFGCAVGPAAADVITDWNAQTLTVVGSGGRPVPSGMLDIAMVHIAMHDAIQAYQGRFEFYNGPITGASGSPIAAAARAARDVLVNRFPAQAGSIEASYQTYLGLNGLLPIDAGVPVGMQAAANIIQRRANDGSFPQNQQPFTGGTELGMWRPTPPGFAAMSAHWYGDVVPFALKDSAGLLPEPPPPHLTSGLYARDYNEVKAMGARTDSSRTPAQTDLALFYSDNFFAQLNRALRGIAAAHITDIGDSARLFALANVAGADGLISAWSTKKLYCFWRPSTAILNGDSDGNPRTAGSSTWLPLINDPPYPDYTSGANTITSAFMRTLALFFDSDSLTFDLTSTVAPVVQKTRTYYAFSEVADDVVEARILLGIHFRFADTVARRQGKQSAEQAFAHILQPLD